MGNSPCSGRANDPPAADIGGHLERNEPVTYPGGAASTYVPLCAGSTGIGGLWRSCVR